MPAAGQYNVRLRWLKLNAEPDNLTGDEVPVHTFEQYLWASVDETNGRRQEEAGAPQSGVDVEIRLRNYPEVQATDLLEDDFLGYVYHIDALRNGDDELIVDAYRMDTLIDFNIEDDS